MNRHAHAVSSRREAKMAIEVTVPEMGESILEATVSHWLKKEGEYVNVGDVLVELETDKVNVEVGAKGAGVLQQIKVQDVLGRIDEKNTQTQTPAPDAKRPKKAESAPKPPEPGREQKPDTSEVS